MPGIRCRKRGKQFKKQFQKQSQKSQQFQKRCQIALFILTKFAMLFFIFSLAALVMVFGNRQRDNICEDEANRIARAVASSIAYVINSPVEDERKIYALEPSLAVGREDFERYVIKITHHNSTKLFSIEVAPAAYGACSGGAQVKYPEGLVIEFYSDPEKTGEQVEPGGVARVQTQSKASLAIHPSGHPKNWRWRSFFLIVMKCGTKEWPKADYLFIQSCEDRDAGRCMNFDSLLQGTTHPSDVCKYA